MENILFLGVPILKHIRVSTKFLILSKVYSDEGGIKYSYHGSSASTGVNPRVRLRLVDYLLG